MRIRNRLPLVGQGAFGGFIASVCCAIPAAMIAAGLSGGMAATLLGLSKYRPYAILAGLAFIAIASWVSLRRSRACCTAEEYQQRQITVPLTMLASFAAIYGLIIYLIIPLLYRMG